jgi:hypothetical protein
MLRISFFYSSENLLQIAKIAGEIFSVWIYEFCEYVSFLQDKSFPLLVFDLVDTLYRYNGENKLARVYGLSAAYDRCYHPNAFADFRAASANA